MGGLVLSFYVPSCRGGKGKDLVFAPNAFLRVSPDNKITVILSKVEMGQGIWTTLPMLIAEELDCELTTVNVEHSPPSLEYKHTFLPHQSTVGSTSTSSEFDRYRYAGATARALLIQAAADKLGVLAAKCVTEKGFVLAEGRRIPYGDLVADAAKLKIPEVSLKDPSEWKYIGKPQKRLDSKSKILGKAQFGIDFQAPGLKTALLLRPPVFNAKAKSYDDDEALKVKGVHKIVETSKGIAVIGDTFWSAKRGRDALVVEWEHDRDAEVDSVQQFLEYGEMAMDKGVVVQEKGNVESALGAAARLIEVEYWLPYLAHAPMEPLNCSVKILSDSCEIWTGTQLLTTDQIFAAELLNIPPERVMIHTPVLGGSFGRRGSLNSDFIVEAVEIAKLSGEFIKLVWTREDDIRGGYYRPSYFHKARIGLDSSFNPIAWEHRVVGQGVFRNTFVIPDSASIDYSSVEWIVGSPYFDGIADHSIQLHTTDQNVPVLPWRSVGYTHTCFVMESLIDEIAHEQKRDPLAFRKDLLKNYPRYLSVLKTVENKSEWSKPAVKGVGKGVAVCERSGTYVAYVVEAAVEDGKVRVYRVVCAVDCGLAVDPNGVRAQIESSVVFGLTMALYGEITMDGGVVKQSNFDDYKMLRIKEMPEIEVHIVGSRQDPMGGIGESGLPPIAPALTNALFAVTGKRIRRLPIVLQ